MRRAILALVLPLVAADAIAQAMIPIADAHIHYNSEARELYSPEAVLKLFAELKITRAIVSSTPDAGTLALFRADPARIVPFTRPYRGDADRANWFRNPEIGSYLEQELKTGLYRGIGEFHLYGGETNTPVVRRMVALAVENDLPLLAHSDARAVEELFAINPRVRIIWAHAGLSEPPAAVAAVMERHPGNLWAEVSSRSDIAPEGRLDPAWRALFLRYPRRFMTGSDTYTTGRWAGLQDLASASRAWLAQLPPEVAENIGRNNLEALFP